MAEFTQVNVNLTEEDAEMVDRMMREDGIDNRSAFMRRMVRQEWAKRFSQPNAAISVGEALVAAEALKKAE